MSCFYYVNLPVNGIIWQNNRKR